MLHSEESDFKTAYSYFYEAFETFNGIEDATNALVALKYMLMTKIMTGHVGVCRLLLLTCFNSLRRCKASSLARSP